MGPALSWLVGSVLASPTLQKFVKLAAWTLLVAVFFFVKGCEWKANRVAAAERLRVPRVAPGPRPVLFPRIRGIVSAPIEACAAVVGRLAATSQPSAPPADDPAATSDDQAATEQAGLEAIEAIRQAATIPTGPAPAAASCGPSGCSSGNCSRRPAGGGYTWQRRGVFGRLFR